MALDEFDGGYNPSDTGRTLSVENLTDGEYTLRIAAADLVKTERTGEEILRWQYQVVAGPSMPGATIEAVNFFRSQMSVNLLGADLALLGLPTSSWTIANGKPFSRMLRESLPGLVGVTFTASKVTTKKDARTYHNLRIRARVDSAAPMPPEPSFEVMAKTGLPF